MEINGLHLLLTYQCTFECDHCFFWGSPWQNGTMTIKDVSNILDQAAKLGTVKWIYFEGGEPTLFYPILLKGVREAQQAGFTVGIVSNAYWATSHEDALEWLRPFSGLVEDFSISSDLYHYSELISRQAQRARSAAEALGIPIGIISIAGPDSDVISSNGQIQQGESNIMYRGRAAAKLASKAPHHPWHTYKECPFEDLRNPGRIHVDPLGHLHICNGISIGNLFDEPLEIILSRHEPETHPITGPLLAGGPSELARRYHLPHQETYADACHLCDHIRRQLRPKFPTVLTPDQVYGLYNGGLP